MPVRREGKLNTVGPQLENAVKRGLILGAQEVARKATNKAPRDTGRLKRSITHDLPRQRAALSYVIKVGPNVEYAAIQEFGGKTEPRLITPVNKQALAFDWPNAPAGLKPSKSGKYVFKSVMHPGSTIPAQPYLRPALKESRDFIIQALLKNIIAVFK